MRIAAVAAASLLAGCVPVFTLPMQVSAAGGAMPGPRADPDGPPGLWNVRVGLHPSAFLSRAHRQPFDFGVGYTLDSGKLFASPVYTQGAFVQLGMYAWTWPVFENVAARLGPFATLDVLWQDGGRDAGWGMSTGLAVELNGHVHGCRTGRDIALCGQGLLGGKLFVSTLVREVGGMHYTGLMLGFGWSMPASIGIASAR